MSRITVIGAGFGALTAIRKLRAGAGITAGTRLCSGQGETVSRSHLVLNIKQGSIRLALPAIFLKTRVVSSSPFVVLLQRARAGLEFVCVVPA